MTVSSTFKIGLSIVLLGCGHPAPEPPTNEPRATPRLVHPEEVIIPPAEAEWPRPAGDPTTDFPHYPVGARNAGVEARVVTAFVIGESGRVEYPTISIIARPYDGEFERSVCTFLRTARFSWSPHSPVRGLVIMPFEFTLSSTTVTQPLLPRPDLRSLGDSLRDMTPQQRAAWIESKPHCL